MYHRETLNQFTRKISAASTAIIVRVVELKSAKNISQRKTQPPFERVVTEASRQNMIKNL